MNLVKRMSALVTALMIFCVSLSSFTSAESLNEENPAELENIICPVIDEEELEACLGEIAGLYEENSEVYMFGSLDGYDPKQDRFKWEMKMINSDYAIEKGYTGEGVKVAVIASGCNKTGDLSDNILPGYNMIKENTDVTDASYTGTIMAGQIAAEMNDVGFRGVAPGAKIVPINIFTDDGKSDASVLPDAIRKATDEFECDIICIRAIKDAESDELKSAVDYAVSKGVIIVAAAGDYGNENYIYPASYDNVISVSAIDSKKEFCSYSTYNDKVTVCAPGGVADGVIACLSPTGGYLPWYGTNPAAAEIAGMAAIFKGINKNFSQKDFMDMIESASSDLGDEGYDKYYGYGMADMEKYMKYYFYNFASLGDNDADGEITLKDAKNIASYIAGNLKSLVKEQNADVDKDGKITLKDAILVARVAEGWEGYKFTE